MAIQEQYILSKDPNTGTVLLPQVNNNTAFEIDNDGTGHGLYLHQDGVLASGKYGLYVYSNAVQVNSTLCFIQQVNASSTALVAEISNSGTGHNLQIAQIGVLATNKHGLYVYSSGALVNANSALAYIKITNASSTVPVLEIDNDGAGHGLYIHQDGVLASSKNGLNVTSNVAQVNSHLVFFELSNASSSKRVLCVQNAGSDECLYLLNTGTGVAQEINNDGTNHALYIHQDGNLASGKYGLYIDNNGTPVDGTGRCIRLDGCTVSGTGAILGYIGINVDGTQRAVPYYAIA